MTEKPNGETPTPTPRSGVALKWTYAVLALAFLFVLMPFFFWQSTWFGRPLGDADIAKYLADREHPRKVQHALSQIADRLSSPTAAVRQSAKPWYPRILELAGHREPEIRLTVAWLLGLDNSEPTFREALGALLADAHPLVRRNAALSLVRFGDSSGLPEIRAMLQAYEVSAPRDGTLAQRLKPGDVVNPGTLLGRVAVGGEESEIRSQMPGTLQRWLVAEDATVKQGQAVAAVIPSQEMAWEALRALVLVGTAEDLPEVERYARGMPGMPPMVGRQADLAVRAIRARANN